MCFNWKGTCRSVSHLSIPPAQAPEGLHHTHILGLFEGILVKKPGKNLKKNELSSELNGNGTETSKNLICLSLEAHILWNVGQFALQPNSLSADKKTLTMTFLLASKARG